MSIRLRSRPPRCAAFEAARITLVVLLVCAAAASNADAARLASDVIGSVAGPASSATVRIGYTGGQTVCGLSNAGNRTEIAGFWGRFFPQVSGAEETTVALQTRLHGAWPNPAIHDTVVRFDLAASEGEGLVPVRLDLFDVTGRCVRVLVDEEMAPGAHHIAWNRRSDLGSRVGSGVYFARLRAGRHQETASIVVR